jgi:hypothetical protein
VIPVEVLGPLLVVSVLVHGVVLSTAGRRPPRQWGRPNRAARRRLDRLVAAWPAGATDAEVRWHDLPSATALDLREATWRHGWFPAGDDPDAEGWPVRFTRDRRRATTLAPPQPRDQRLLAELRDADAAGRRTVVLDAVPYLVHPLPWMGEVAARAGWRAGRYLPGGWVPRVEFLRDGGGELVVSGGDDVEFPAPSGPGRRAAGGRAVPRHPRLPPAVQRRYNLLAAVLIGGFGVGLGVAAFGRDVSAAVVVWAVTAVLTVLLWRWAGAARRRAGGGAATPVVQGPHPRVRPAERPPGS